MFSKEKIIFGESYKRLEFVQEVLENLNRAITSKIPAMFSKKSSTGTWNFSPHICLAVS